MTFARILTGTAAVGGMLAVLASPCAAQTALATRERLQADLTQLEHGGNRAAAALIRARLEHGDFQSGDRIVLRVEGEKDLSDTFTVGAQRELTLPQLGVVPLDGVLRAEIATHMQTALARYLHDPLVTVRPLVTIMVEGEVARPGFYSLAPEQPFSNAITAAGGLTARAKSEAIQVKRGAAIIWEGPPLQQAMARGYSLDQLSLGAADRLIVPAHGSSEGVVRILALILSVPIAVLTIHAARR